MKQPFFFAALLALSLPGLARAATLTVPAQYSTIQSAVNAASNGDTVLIADGTYTDYGNVDIDFGGKNITVTSQHGAASTIIDCQGNGVNLHRGFYLHSGESGAVISGLTIENGSENGNSYSTGGAILSVSVSVTIQNCIIKNNTATKGGGIANYCQDGTITVSKCTIINNTVPNYEGGGIYNEMGGSGLIQVEDCTVSANRSSNGAGGGIANYNLSIGTISVTNCTLTKNTTSYGGGLFDFYLYNGPILVTNCSVTRNAAHDGTGEYNNDSQNATTTSPIQLTNDIFYNDVPLASGSGHEIASNPGSTASATVDYSDVQGGFSGRGNLNADPLFVSTTDSHLQPNSPCLGAGTAAGAPTIAIDGEARPNPPSIGAYEAASTTSPVTAGATHVLWNNTNGAASIWNYNTQTGSFTQNTYGPYAGWTAKAIADGGTDGQTRVLWDNNDGRMSLWSLNNSTGQFTQNTFGPYSGWTANAVSVGTDNITHLLWDNTSGAASLWNYSTASGTFTQNTYGPYPGWAAKTVADGADGKTRVLWDNVGGQMSLWNLDNVARVFSQFTYGAYPGWTAGSVSGH